ncbi:MAG: alpha/beta hydrolase [Thiotrichaceae bacterium]|nr:alpha/beta hydrolase [Thiotrichaceae bacterium]
MGKRYFLLTIIAVCAISLASYSYFSSFTRAEIGSKSVLPNGGVLVWTKCWFEAAENIECAKFHTAPRKKGGVSDYILPVVVLRYTGYGRKEDPVLNMAGGPGSPAGLDRQHVFDHWNGWFKRINFKRDIILFDQRGAGLSEPSLSCDSYNKAVKESIFKGSSEKGAHEIINTCYQEMKQKGVPVDQLSTLHSAGDIRDIMDALHYKKWNLYGVSYSTRLAMVVESQNPERVRTLLLDSVYPISQHFFKDWPLLLNKSLERLFIFCKNNSQCATDYGDLQTLLWKTIADLQKNPLRIQLPNIKEEIIFDDELFIGFLFGTQYESKSLKILPEVIYDFSRRDVSNFQKYISYFIHSRIDSSSSELVHRAVECQDNSILSRQEMTKIYKNFPKLTPYLIREVGMCESWKDSHFFELVTLPDSKVPVLLFAGEDDPVTPIEWAESIRGKYTNTIIFSFRDISHSVMDAKDCAIDLYGHFLDDPLTYPSADCRE